MNEQEQLGLALDRVVRPERNLFDQLLPEAEALLSRAPAGFEFTAGRLAAGVAKRLQREPSEGRVWGAVLLSLSRRGLVVKTGRYTTDGRSHGGLAAIWVKV